ncbi:MAG: hypothetical protein PHW04_00875 [Candidatus Wallbacteria bacterium]|nr:hypothetical protein [Candidatus Wallbacteria bacterium]
MNDLKYSLIHSLIPSQAAFVSGMTGIICQILLLRELLVLFSGNEFAIGFILGSWVLWEAAGSLLAGNLLDKVDGRKAYSVCNLLFLISFFVNIMLIRDFKVLTGTGMGVIESLTASVLLLFPSGISHGALLVLAIRLFDGTGAAGSGFGRAYFFETMGTIAGGILGSYFLLPGVMSFSIAAVCLCAGILSTLPLLKGRTFFLALLVLLVLSIFSGPGLQKLNQFTLSRQWKKEPAYYGNSFYQNIAVIKEEEQYTFFTDGIPRLTLPPAEIEAMEDFVHFPMLSQDNPEAVLVLGNGIGGVLREVEKYSSVRRIDCLEPDPTFLATVCDFSRRAGLSELADPRVTVFPEDGRFFVQHSLNGKSAAFPDRRYDVILMGIPAPDTLQSNRFFTAEFFGNAGQLLGDGGVFVCSLPGSLAYYGPELRKLNAVVLHALERSFRQVVVLPGYQNLFLCFNASVVFPTPEGLAERLSGSGISTLAFNRYSIASRMRNEYRDWFYSAMADPAGYNSDRKPIAVFYDLAYRSQIYDYRLSWIFGVLSQPGWAIALFLAACLISGLTGKIKPAVAFSLGSTGFSGMLFQLLLLFGFQAAWGVVFYETGLFTACLMGGIALGTFLTSRSLERDSGKGFFGFSDRQALLGLEIIFFVFFLSQSLVFGFIDPFLSGSVSIHCFFLLPLFFTGVIMGMEFLLCNRICLKSSQAGQGRAAGLIFASDLFGGFLGGVMSGFFIQAALGWPAICLMLAALKLVSLYWLTVAFQKKIFEI